jgi:predicted dehydrogenase
MRPDHSASTAGRLAWSHGDARLHVESTEPAWVVAPTRDLSFTLPLSSSYGGAHGEAFVRDFIRATYTGDPPPASGHDALQVARITDVAYASSQSGRRVDVAPPSDSAPTIE